MKKTEKILLIVLGVILAINTCLMIYYNYGGETPKNLNPDFVIPGSAIAIRG